MADTSRPVPARLFVHLAREAPVGVILRRGPSKWVQIILWHTDTDTFEFGQWLHGRIYERVCDISPDGAIFLYFAADYSEEIAGAPHTPTFMWKWTAMSRPPYLTALALWPNFDDRYRGGGFFGDSRTVYLFGEETETRPAQGSIPGDMEILRIQVLRERGVEIAGPGMLNGWKLTQEGQGARLADIPYPWNYRAERPAIYEKVQPGGRYILLEKVVGIKADRPGGDYIREWGAKLDSGEGEMDLGEADWADWDQNGRLVSARAGKLYEAQIEAASITEHELADFNDQRFEEVIAPEWAQHW